MDQFSEAKLRNEKRLERLARSNANMANKPDPETKAEPKVVKATYQPGPMVLQISGPVEMTLEVDYAGTLISGQINEANLKAMFKKCLLPIGKVR